MKKSEGKRVVKRSKLPAREPALLRIGWREWIALPELGIPRIKVKVDTGARTSSLHAYNIRRFRRRNQPWIRFILHPYQKNTRASVEAQAEVIEERWVKSSSGHSTFRPVILTPMQIGRHMWPIELTLIQRDLMGFRMLVGRQALRHRFLVDPGGSYLLGKK